MAAMLEELLDPPTDVEVEAQRALLLSDRVADGSMTLSQMDGFITGLVAGPWSPPPDDWVPQIFGDDPPVRKNEEEAAQYGIIILRRSIQIAEGLQEKPPLLRPWLDRDADGKPDPGPWAEGLLQAIAQAPSRWTRMMKDPEGGLVLLPLLAFAR